MKQGSQIVWSKLLLGVVFSFWTTPSFAASDTPAAPSPAVFDSSDSTARVATESAAETDAKLPLDYVTGQNGKQYLNRPSTTGKWQTKFRKKTKLTYPRKPPGMLPGRVQFCTLGLLVNESGTVDEIQIVDCPEVYQKSMDRIQKQWTLDPIEHEGTAIPFIYSIQVAMVPPGSRQLLPTGGKRIRSPIRLVGEDGATLVEDTTSP